MRMLTIIEQSTGDLFTFYDNNLGTIIRKMEGFEYADVIPSIDDVAGPYGATYITSKHGVRRCSIEGDLISEDVYEVRRRLLNALRQTGTIKLIKFTTYDSLDLQFEAEVVKVLNPYTHKVHSYLIEFKAPDWRFYSQTLKTYDLTQTVLRAGASIPASIPWAIPASTDPMTELNNIIINEGNETTDPVFTITGPGTEFTITNQTTNQSLVLDRTLVSEDEVVIDVKNRTVVLNGNTNVYPDVSGDFWSLIPGENELRFFVSSGLTVDTNLNVSYRDAYAGV